MAVYTIASDAARHTNLLQAFSKKFEELRRFVQHHDSSCSKSVAHWKLTKNEGVYTG